jgi:hypothetical protein
LSNSFCCKRSFCQDRLGTNTGKVEKREAFSAGLGDWMPVQGTSIAYTGPGFERMSYLAFANITELLGKPAELTTKYRAKAAAVRKTASFECFPYVCPEPVLAKCSFLYIDGSKMPFSAGRRSDQREVSERIERRLHGRRDFP